MANNTCDPYWEHADWLPPWYILDHWCQQDARCRQAKQQALLSACERGDIYYRRSDGKTFDDPIHELVSRGILLIDRDSFDAWATTVDGKSPLPARPRKQPPYPGWASPGTYRFDEDQWDWVPDTPPVSSRPPVTPPGQSTDTLPQRTVTPPAWVQEMQAAEANAPVSPTNSTREDATGADDQDDGDADVEADAPVTGVPSSAIIDAFRIKDSDTDNAQWWDQRMRDAKRYGLINARTAKGQLQNPSYWRPDLIACWLVDKHHLSAKTVKRIVLIHFPDWADTLDYLGD